MDGHPFYELIGNYGLIAVFVLAMIEGDITLLLAGVLAHSGFFGEYSFAKVLCAGTLGGVAGDSAAWGVGHGFGHSVRNFRYYRMAKPRMERLTDKFGGLSIFISKYIYGLRTASCIFYGVGRMRFARFLPLAFASCFAWVLVLTGAGYFFSGAITNLIGDFQQIGKVLLVLVVLGIIGFYLAERFWLSKKVEEVSPQQIQKLEGIAHETLHDLKEEIHEIKEEIQERIHLKKEQRRKDTSQQKRTPPKPGEAEGD
jgi:membrane protein DedA with SNARE-associated domain